MQVVTVIHSHKAEGEAAEAENAAGESSDSEKNPAIPPITRDTSLTDMELAEMMRPASERPAKKRDSGSGKLSVSLRFLCFFQIFSFPFCGIACLCFSLCAFFASFSG